ncbi:MAG TPA: hypothetical protein VHX16_04505 [Chloroflexota bacterium]|jgi:hypothetical protein|nr:hypothetical protein [Chloroflexota bacterium]
MAIPPESQIPLANELIGVQAGDEAVAKLQLAARWAERYSGASEDMNDVLKRFRLAYDYVDAVTNGVEPEDS